MSNVAELCDKIKHMAEQLEDANPNVEPKMLILIAVEEILGSEVIAYETPSLEPISIDRSQVSFEFDSELGMDIMLAGEPKEEGNYED